jgi:hypothetical protein
MNATVMTLAMHCARNEVKASILRQQGHRALREMERTELTRLARAYLDRHPEQAAETVRNVPALRRMAQRDARERLKR